ncbi:DUF192 domain-containing protein [Qipengyuania marisflavi]|uniref:DUF192 domain-containing protein n=1 Tax=Qipengyuania marisflavi TaxID=2486356 RepID=A0A5S3P026_9SPHN|nr:DUF192 domain-containing protein [Qipengyuania marisflavi]TMM46140.1 DUF192 domain-containing protein [Qipengyuania marisflavi]
MGRRSTGFRRSLGLAAAAAALTLAACSPQPAAQATPASESAASVHPVSGLAVIPLTVTSGSAVHRFRVEVAASNAEQSKGMMFRTEMGPDEGMIFPSDVPSARSFWMKNTPLPLDIIFIGTDGRILNVEYGEPYKLEPVSSAGITANVLELNAGRAAALGIGPGDLVEW